MDGVLTLANVKGEGEHEEKDEVIIGMNQTHD